MRASLLAASLLLFAACSKPSPPTLTPKKATLTYVSPLAIGLEVTLDATNTNAMDLVAGDVTARVLIDKRIEVGTATIADTVTLPANQTVEVKASGSIPWADIVPIATLAASGRKQFPYTVEGTLALRGEMASVTVPFRLDGEVTREQLLRATLKAAPDIPGVTSPPTDGGATPPPSPGAVPINPRIRPPRTVH